MLQDPDAPKLLLGVSSLPKDALIEKQVVVHTGRFVGTEDDENEVQSLAPSLATGMSYAILAYKPNTTSLRNDARRCCLRGLLQV